MYKQNGKDLIFCIFKIISTII